ncbi:methionyl-tRNA synthetase [Actinobacteria bacterium IMCC26256]|nr:methionyl-tRNA synthetase [Actinobacteria bacterium IMCC26256]
MAQKFYVTTPIYYVNDVPHIGHAYTTVAADTLARWRRLHGDDVVFLTGTDEHGLKVQQAAEKNGVSPQEWADKTSLRFAETWKMLDITNTDFIRTTEPRHRVAVQEFLQRVYDNGFIELDSYEGLYCVPCEAYYVEDDLNNGNCPDHGIPVERVKEENYFFRLSRFEQRLLDYYAEHPEAVAPESRRNEVLGFIKQGLRDFSMSRTSITWGIPLPWDENHVTYVWFDALFNYCTAVGFSADPERFAEVWPADYHLIGKDILRFHAVFWPAMLMAAGLEPPKHVFAHGFLMVGGERMSKTRLNQIAPADLVETFGSDGFRYHFLVDQHFGPDGDFSFEQMLTRYNADLANNFGNLASRVLNMAVSYCDSATPSSRENGPLAAASVHALERLETAMESLNFSSGFTAVWDFIGATNAYIEDRQPWALSKAGDAEATAAVIGDCLEALRIIAILSSPVLPRASSELWSRLGLPGSPTEARLPTDVVWGSASTVGNSLVKGAALFPRLDVPS